MADAKVTLSDGTVLEGAAAMAWVKSKTQVHENMVATASRLIAAGQESGPGDRRRMLDDGLSLMRELKR